MCFPTRGHRPTTNNNNKKYTERRNDTDIHVLSNVLMNGFGFDEATPCKLALLAKETTDVNSENGNSPEYHTHNEQQLLETEKRKKDQNKREKRRSDEYAIEMP